LLCPFVIAKEAVKAQGKARRWVVVSSAQWFELKTLPFQTRC
jgi:mRNA-degrading endonuclease toxin of MazEF toxin-antitoxin module